MSAAAIITEAAVFAAGAVAGIVAIVSVGIQREERYFRKTGLVSLTRLAPDRVSKRTRGLVGLSVRQRDDLKPCGTESIHRRPADSIRQLTATTTVLADGQP
jgi:hypothetical protein